MTPREHLSTAPRERHWALRLRPAAAVVAAYVLAGGAWIIGSNWLLAVLPEERALLVQTARGLGFVAVTGAALYLALGRMLDAIEDGARVQHALAAEVRSRAEQQRRLAHRLMHAEEETRRAVAKDLHDGPLQSLTLTFMQLDTAARAMRAGEPPEPERVTSAMRAVREASEDIRAVLRALHPPLLAELGLAAAAERLCRESAERAGRDVTYEGEKTLPALESEAAIALFRILQEALANALKHTQAGAIRVDLRPDGEMLVLRVTDAGPGFRTEGLDHLGLGLVSMRERAESVGAQFSLHTGPQGGTSVHVQIRLRDALAGASGPVAAG